MQIVVPLGADTDARGAARPPFDQLPVGKPRSFPGVDRFVCDQARVRMLTVKKSAETATDVAIDVALTLVSEWPLQDVDLTVALVSAKGEVTDKHLWKALTLGAWSHSYSPPRATFHIAAERWRELFSEGQAPAIRITVDIQE